MRGRRGPRNLARSRCDELRRCPRATPTIAAPHWSHLSERLWLRRVEGAVSGCGEAWGGWGTTGCSSTPHSPPNPAVINNLRLPPETPDCARSQHRRRQPGRRGWAEPSVARVSRRPSADWVLRLCFAGWVSVSLAPR